MKEHDFLGNPICGNAPSTALHIADYYSHQEHIKIIMDRLNPLVVSAVHLCSVY